MLFHFILGDLYKMVISRNWSINLSFNLFTQSYLYCSMGQEYVIPH